jgi:organic hydroperoxide reductase OsmC/OhrA
VGVHTATIRWSLGDGDFQGNRYSRAHEWCFDGGLTVPASASPQVVPLPLSVAEHVDPEEAFVASLSSCHMLFFLSLAAAVGIVVERYTDEATGWMEKNAAGRMAISRVLLRPQASYQGESPPQPGEIERLHHRAHECCFIANSVKTEIATEIVS